MFKYIIVLFETMGSIGYVNYVNFPFLVERCKPLGFFSSCIYIFQ